MPGGRPTKYEERFVEELYQYLTEKLELITVGKDGRERGAQVPTRAGFAKRIGVDVDTLKNWENPTEHPEFFGALKALDAQQEDMLANGGLTGTHNATMAIFLLKNNHGYTDKTQQELSGPNGGPMQFERIERVVIDSKK